LAEMRTELVKLRTSVKSGGNIENTGRIRDLKRTVARVLTIAHEKPVKETAEA
jgi:large subunit ribosomal protein L29